MRLVLPIRRTHTFPQIVPASDRAMLVAFGDAIGTGLNADVLRFLAALRREANPGIVDLHPAYASVLVAFDPTTISPGSLLKVLDACLRELHDLDLPPERRIEIPVCYDDDLAPDLRDVAEHAGLTPEEAVQLYTAAEYRVHFLGFAPGFGYLGGLPDRLATPRLSTPRTRVPPGSVGIAGKQTGVYPGASPGGWRLIGRTPLRLFRPEHTPPARLEIGDRVRFRRIVRAAFDRLALEDILNPPLLKTVSAGQPVVRVERPGFLSTIQDRGRRGLAHVGLSAAGAADPVALRIGNALLGNPPDAAAIEMTLTGGTFLFEAEAIIAVTGSDFAPSLGGSPIPHWHAVRIPAGARLEFGATRSGARCTLCVRGGFDVARVLGSASTHLLAGLGGCAGRALIAGDTIGIGFAPPTQPRRDLDPGCRLYPSGPIRVTPGPQHDWFEPAALDRFAAATYMVTERSDRMGLRLEGPELASADRGSMLTEGVGHGAVQVPESGQPIVLLVEHQTTGGYPKVANVCSADLHRLGQLRPRDKVCFTWIDFEMAHRLHTEQEDMLRALGAAP